MTAFRQCSSSGCLRRAEYVPKICVPAQGFPVEANKHLSVIIGVQLCEDHMVTVEPEQFLNRQTRGIIDAFTKGKVPPDYDRAFLLPVDVESPEFKKWERERRKGLTQ